MRVFSETTNDGSMAAALLLLASVVGCSMLLFVEAELDWFGCELVVVVGVLVVVVIGCWLLAACCSLSPLVVVSLAPDVAAVVVVVGQAVAGGD